MKKHIGLFIVTTTLCATMLALVMTENITDAIRAGRSQDEPYDPARAASLRKQFERMGLTLHEGKYWK
jgi:hypothetical protein